MEFIAHGLHCFVVAGPQGSPNGYVEVPKKHPLFGIRYNEQAACLKPMLKEAGSRPCIDINPILLLCAAVEGGIPCKPEYIFDVHQGLTYSGPKPCKGGGGWWFGFDTAHFCDGPKTQNFDFVSSECEKLAAQLAKMM